jgi:MFS family permease
MELTPRRAVIALAIINFIISFQGGLTIYLDSKYLTSALSSLGVPSGSTDSALGIVYALAAAVALLELIWMPKLLRKFGARNVAIAGSIVMMAGLALFAFHPNNALIIISYPLYSIIPLLIAFDVLAEAYIKEEEVARIRSYIYAIGSFGMLLAPALGGRLAEHFGLSLVYGVAACIIAPVSILFAWSFRKHVDVKYEDTPIFIEPHLKKETPDLMPIFWTQMMIQSFYMLMVVYVPLILQNAGVGAEDFGKIMTVALLAFVIVPGPLGYFADKYIGEKEFITAGLVIMGSALLTFPILIQLQPPLWVWAIVFLISRIGAAAAESMADAFFFKKYQTSHPALVVFYRRARPLAQLFFPAVAAGLLATGIIKDAIMLTFIFGFFLIVSAVFPLRLNDTK